MAAKHAEKTGSKALVISHCNCPERAEKIKAMIEKKHKFDRVDIVMTGGIATLYAAEGGIIIGC